MYDVVIVGAGPAGISAGLYAKRSGLNVLVLYHGQSNLEKASKIDNYYGFTNGIDGETLYKTGIAQAKNLGIDVIEEEVTGITKLDTHFVIEANNEYSANAVILSTGNKKLRPEINGIAEFEGKGISYCAICDGFFYRGKNVTVIGNSKFALNEAKVLKNIASKVTILTNGETLQETSEFEVIKEKIRAIHGNGTVDSVEFSDGSVISTSGIFIALGEAGSADFAKRLGIILNGDNIAVDKNMQTNIPGVFACGDATGGLLQVSKAVYEGTLAGLSAINYIKNK
ncbi:MAG: NAD(P)/FAD-dependent oxidoreductase [Clostridia bacterium]|nr:NAD(P)/FAD-dependent oxidoreductase [Clostridia bacterium]